MKICSCLAIACLVACAACTPVAKDTTAAFYVKQGAQHGDLESRATLIGRWFSESVTPAGERKMELKELRRDGTFKTIFRAVAADGHVSEQTEIGLWGVAGRVYFTITQGYLVAGVIDPVSPEDPSYYDAYEILRLDAEEFDIRAAGPKVRFDSRKVPPSFRLPDIL